MRTSDPLRRFVEDVYTWGVAAPNDNFPPILADPADPEQWRAYLMECHARIQRLAYRALRDAGYGSPSLTVDR